MTENKSLKRKVRARMDKTGERYTAARRQVLTRADEPAEPPPSPEPGATAAPRDAGGPSDETLAARTGRPWEEWRNMLDAWGAGDQPHPKIARWLVDGHGVDGWWAQSLTVRYEKEIGRRVLGQRSGGIFAASATKTVNAPVDEAFAAFADDDRRARWLPGVELKVRTVQAARSIRFGVGDGAERLIVGFEPKGDRCTVSIEHERLADAAATTRTKQFWRERLADLKRMLEA